MLELDHWVLFDTMSNDQIGRLKAVIQKKVATIDPPADSADSFKSMLAEETEKIS